KLCAIAGLGPSDLIVFRDHRVYIVKNSHSTESEQQASQTEYCDEKKPVFSLGRYRCPLFRWSRRLNAECQGSRRCKNERKENEQGITHWASPRFVAKLTMQHPPQRARPPFGGERPRNPIERAGIRGKLRKHRDLIDPHSLRIAEHHVHVLHGLTGSAFGQVIERR